MTRQELNKKIIVDLYETVFSKHDVEGVDKYIIGGESAQITKFKIIRNNFISQFPFHSYIQHNPWIEDGRSQLKESIRSWFKAGPWESEILKTAAEGDYVWLHVRATSPALKSVLGGNGTVAIVEIFRLEEGVVVEHWDVIQKIPDMPANSHPMF